MAKFKNQNGLGGGNKNIYEDFVEDGDEDIVAENFG
jgi:hypothetical protein